MSQDYILIDSNGESCKECKSEWNYPDEENHEKTCSHHWQKKELNRNIERKNCQDGEMNAITKEVWCARYGEFCKFVKNCQHR